MYVARGAAIEFYEQVRGLMSVEVPGTLGRTFRYYGYVATFIADSDLAWKYSASEGEYFKVKAGKIVEFNRFTPRKSTKSYRGWWEYDGWTDEETEQLAI